MPTHIRDVTFEEDSENIVGCLLQAGVITFPCIIMQKSFIKEKLRYILQKWRNVRGLLFVILNRG